MFPTPLRARVAAIGKSHPVGPPEPSKKVMQLLQAKSTRKEEETETEEETESEGSTSGNSTEETDASTSSGSSSNSSETSDSEEEDTESEPAAAAAQIKKTVVRSTDEPSLPTSSSILSPRHAPQPPRTTQGPFRSSGPNGDIPYFGKPTAPIATASTTTNNNNAPAEEGAVGGAIALPSTRATPRTGRRRKRRALTICLAHCRYDIVRKTSEKHGLVEVSEDQPWNLYWTDYSVSLERAVEMRRYQIVNHFPGMNEICRKDLLARNLNRMRRNFPHDYDIYPMSWCLPADGNELASYSATRKGRTYICKPEMGCQGRGIFLVKNVKDLNPFGRIICQVYIQKPFLIDHLKFDLRIYVLITSCDPLRIWVYKDGLARFATAKYRQPASSNTENSYMHLTNYAVNKFSRDYIMDCEESGSKRKLSTVYQWLQERDYDIVKLSSEIDDIIIKTILSAHPILKHHYRTCFPHHDICSACFELLGFDILLDHKLKPYVIEVNHSPSFHMDTNLDRQIKEDLLRDTFSMLNLKQLDRRKIENEDRKRVQQRLARKVIEMKHKTGGNKGAGDAPKSSGRNRRGAAGGGDPEAPPHPTKLSPVDAQFKWEIENSGGYRLIFPLPDSEKYDRFLDQNVCSIYQETAASQARANMTRTQLDEFNNKKQADEKKRPVGHNGKEEKEKEKTRPSTQNGHRKGSASSSGPRELSFLKPVQSSFSSLSIDFGIGNKSPSGSPIITKEEYDRAKSLMQRGMLIRSLGIELQVYNLLSQVGTLKPMEHEEFRKKHGFAVGHAGMIQRIQSTAPRPSNVRPPHTAPGHGLLF